MYTVPVKIEGMERRKKTGRLFHAIAGFFLVTNTASYINHATTVNWLIVTFFLALSLCCLLYGFFQKRFDPQVRYNLLMRSIEVAAYVFLAILLMPIAKGETILSLTIWSVVLVILLLTERNVYHETSLQIKEEGVFIPGYFVQHQMPWDVINEFVLRPDYVTIFRTNQKYMQLELMRDVSALEIQQINAFCKDQISKSEKA